MDRESKIWKYIGIASAIYIVIWFWPVIFNRPFFNNDRFVPVDISPRPPMTVVVPIDTIPGYDPRFGGDGYEDHAPMPITDIPYDPSNPDPIAPPHSADEPGDRMVACTMEAKACPDGSYVGRQGPNCEFSPCPGN